MNCATCGKDISELRDQYGNLWRPQCWHCWQSPPELHGKSAEDIASEVVAIDDEISELEGDLDHHGDEIYRIEDEIETLKNERAKLKSPKFKKGIALNLKDFWEWDKTRVSQLMEIFG
jgi:hypothetical protein